MSLPGKTNARLTALRLSGFETMIGHDQPLSYFGMGLTTEPEQGQGVLAVVRSTATGAGTWLFIANVFRQ